MTQTSLSVPHSTTCKLNGDRKTSCERSQESRNHLGVERATPCSWELSASTGRWRHGRCRHPSKSLGCWEARGKFGQVFPTPTQEIEETTNDTLLFGCHLPESHTWEVVNVTCANTTATHQKALATRQQLTTDEVARKASTGCSYNFVARDRLHHGVTTVKAACDGVLANCRYCSGPRLCQRLPNPPLSSQGGWLATSPVERWMLTSPPHSASNTHLAIPTTTSTPPVSIFSAMDVAPFWPAKRVVVHGSDGVTLFDPDPRNWNPEPKLVR